MTVTFQPVHVAVADEGEGRLVFCDDKLVAVLVQLSPLHEDAGRWFLEVGFGRLDVPMHPTFDDLDSAEAWIRDRLAEDPLRQTG